MGTTQPFRFMDLPKEIRLVVYEKLPIVTRRHDVPLRDRQHHLTLVNTTIAGVSILATCRQVNEEASYILAPRLRKTLKAPPKVVIEAHHLVGLIDLHDQFRIWVEEHILDRILRALYKPKRMKAVHRYRAGRMSVQTLRNKLKLKALVEDGDEATFNAFVTFVLRAAAYIESNPNALFRCPPLDVVIVVPTTFTAQPVTTTTSLAMVILYKLSAPHLPTLPRAMNGVLTLSSLLQQFAFHSTWTCEIYRTVSLCIKMKHESCQANVHQVHEQAFQVALRRGLHDARSKEGLLYYGGFADEQSEGE
jgi:hypothetical protein